MRTKIVQIQNVKALVNAYEAVGARAIGAPGIVLVHGVAGHGKTSATCWLAVKRNALFLTALPVWTPASMLAKLAEEIGIKPVRGAARMFDVLARELTMRPRPIFLDEADCIMDARALVETLRIFHDMTALPLFLIGMGEAKRKIEARPQLSRRIMAEVEFRPLTLDDARAMTTELCEVALADELIELVHRQSKGSAGRLCAELSRLETFARRRGLARLAISDLGERERAAFTAVRIAA